MQITQKGRLRLMSADGVELSQHVAEREAVEAAINRGPGRYVLKQPDIELVVDAPEPAPEPPPEKPATGLPLLMPGASFAKP